MRERKFRKTRSSRHRFGNRSRTSSMRPMRVLWRASNACQKTFRGTPRTMRRTRDCRRVDVGNVATDIAGQNIHGPAQRYGQMCVVPANPALLDMDVIGRFGRAPESCIRRWSVRGRVADRLAPVASRVCRIRRRPRQSRPAGLIRSKRQSLPSGFCRNSGPERVVRPVTGSGRQSGNMSDQSTRPPSGCHDPREYVQRRDGGILWNFGFRPISSEPMMLPQTSWGQCQKYQTRVAGEREILTQSDMCVFISRE